MVGVWRKDQNQGHQLVGKDVRSTCHSVVEGEVEGLLLSLARGPGGCGALCFSVLVNRLSMGSCRRPRRIFLACPLAGFEVAAEGKALYVGAEGMSAKYLWLRH